VKEAIKKKERDLYHEGHKLALNVHTPLSTNYRPELNFSKPLDTDYAN
jgi:hypothetical protein